MNIEQARTNMISQQIRACDVLNDSLLDLIRETPREYYVPDEYRNLAFADTNIPLGHGEVMMTPETEAQMLTALQIKKSETVLEIGTGSGYVTALFAQLAKHVTTIDIIPEFIENAKEKHRHFNYTNIEYVTANAAQGWDENKTYDVIAITGSLPLLPETFKNKMSLGGRLFVILGKPPIMQAALITRNGSDIYSTQILFETMIKPLQHTVSNVFQF